MIKASDFMDAIAEQRNKKFEEMLSIQESFIAKQMKEGKRSVIWIFSDKEYYLNELEKSWYYPFEMDAREIFENNGFKITGIVIRW